MTAYVTTSWDDGGVHDVRLAEFLADRGVPATFYWTLDSERFPLPPTDDRRVILDAGIEVGSHTMTHPDVRRLDGETLAWELTESKRRLEELTERPVTTFCYPFGYFDRTSRDAVASAGYRIGRTTMGFRTDLGDDPHLIPTTIQMYPHGRRVHLTHGMRERNLRGLGAWLTTYRGEHRLARLAELAIDRAIETGGVVHIWGHSWELEEFGLWGELRDVLDVVGGRDDVRYVTNGALPVA